MNIIKYSTQFAKSALRATLVLAVSTGIASANNIDLSKLSAEQLHKALAVKIRIVQHMALNPLLVKAVQEQNAEGLKPATIESRDKEWKKNPANHSFKLSLQNSEAGRFLKRKVADGKKLNEAFLTDNQGANVATYPATGDYNQGDEEKWSASWNNGKGQIFIGKPELDKSTGIQAVQVSAPVIHKGTTIGVLVVGVAVNHLAEQSKQPSK